MKKLSDKATRVRHTQIKKLTHDDLRKITGGCCGIRDCTGPTQATCIAYLLTGNCYQGSSVAPT